VTTTLSVPLQQLFLPPLLKVTSTDSIKLRTTNQKHDCNVSLTDWLTDWLVHQSDYHVTGADSWHGHTPLTRRTMINAHVLVHRTFSPFISRLCEQVYGGQSSSICSSLTFSVCCCSFTSTYTLLAMWGHLSYSTFSFPFILRSMTSCSKTSFLRTCPIHPRFRCSTLTLSNTDAFVTLLFSLIFSILLQTQTSQASKLSSSTVHISHYRVTSLSNEHSDFTQHSVHWTQWVTSLFGSVFRWDQTSD